MIETSTTIPTKRLQNGFEMPVYGFGLWNVGGRREREEDRDDEGVEAIRQAIGMGITHIDTAESYGQGHSEELLGEAIEGHDRQNLFLATKVKPEHQSYDDIIAACEASLNRIGTDYIDLYMLHRFPAPGINIADTMRALDQLVQRGLVKNIGLSNVTAHRFEVAQSFSENTIVANQVHYNVQHRETELRGVIKHAQENDTMLVAYRPLQKGELPESAIVTELANKYGKTPAQISLNWLIMQKNVVTLSRTVKREHLIENLGALGWEMDPEDVERIRQEFPDQQTVSDTGPLDYASDTEV